MARKPYTGPRGRAIMARGRRARQPSAEGPALPPGHLGPWSARVALALAMMALVALSVALALGRKPSAEVADGQPLAPVATLTGYHGPGCYYVHAAEGLAHGIRAEVAGLIGPWLQGP